MLGFGLGSQEVTAAEADEYVQAVDAASSRVVSGVLATSWDGHPLRYADELKQAGVEVVALRVP